FCHYSIVKVPFLKRAKFYQPHFGLSRPIETKNRHQFSSTSVRQTSRAFAPVSGEKTSLWLLVICPFWG
ncbi:MAG: hypothetical protein MUO62_12035, partial [Anaerolineales bacterium]|nr:hypothetical protein [Anaerolineales bacterium]